MTIDTDKALEKLRERVMDGVEGCYPRCGRDRESCRTCPMMNAALDTLLALNAAVARAEVLDGQQCQWDANGADDCDGDTCNSPLCAARRDAGREADRLAREALAEAT